MGEDTDQPLDGGAALGIFKGLCPKGLSRDGWGYSTNGSKPSRDLRGFQDKTHKPSQQGKSWNISTSPGKGGHFPHGAITEKKEKGGTHKEAGTRSEESRNYRISSAPEFHSERNREKGKTGKMVLEILLLQQHSWKKE